MLTHSSSSLLGWSVRPRYPKCPDLNPIENLWYELKFYLESKGQATKQRRTGEGHQKVQAEEDNPREVQKVHGSRVVQGDFSHSRGSRCSNTILKTALFGATAPCYVECCFNIALQVTKNGSFRSYHILQKSMTNMGYILVLNRTLIKHSLQIETKWLHPFLAWTLFLRHFSLFSIVISMIDPFREDEIIRIIIMIIYAVTLIRCMPCVPAISADF